MQYFPFTDFFIISLFEIEIPYFVIYHIFRILQTGKLYGPVYSTDKKAGSSSSRHKKALFP